MKPNLIFLKSLLAIALVLAACGKQGGLTKVNKARNSGSGGGGVGPLANLEPNDDTDAPTKTGQQIDPKTKKPIPSAGTVRYGKCSSLTSLRNAFIVKENNTPVVVTSYDFSFSTSYANLDDAMKPSKSYAPAESNKLNDAIRARLFMTKFPPAWAMGIGSDIIKTDGPLSLIAKYFADIDNQKNCATVTIANLTGKHDVDILYKNRHEIRFIEGDEGRVYIDSPDYVILKIVKFLPKDPYTCSKENVTVQQSFVITIGKDIGRVLITPSLFTFLATQTKSALLSSEKPPSDLKINTQVYQLVKNQITKMQAEPPACPAN